MSHNLENYEELLELIHEAGKAVAKAIAYAHVSGIYIPKLATLATVTAEVSHEVASRVSRLRGKDL